MFTGIVEEVGRIAAIESVSSGVDTADAANAVVLTVECSTVLTDVHLGDSIAVNGVCLTVTSFTESSFTADVMKVTLDYTAIGGLQVGDSVNLERAMAADGRFGGHIVQGHVDGTATLVSRHPSEAWEVFRFRLDDPRLGRYLVHKGSITINGTSLTIAEIADASAFGNAGESDPWWDVSLIPTTLRDTMLGTLRPGDKVNIEVDVLAKYAERMMQFTCN